MDAPPFDSWIPHFRLDTANQQLWRMSLLLPLPQSSDALHIAAIDPPSMGD